MTNNRAIDEEDDFNRLPDDLLFSIMSRLNDLKDICQCSLVSKRFASMLTHFETLSLKFPDREISSRDKFVQFVTFLTKFTKLELLYLEFTCQENCPQHLMWKAQCERKSPEILGFVSLLSNSPDDDNDYDHHSFCLADVGKELFTNCVNFVNLVSILVKRHHLLKSVIIRDSKKQGKLVLEDEQLVMWRNSKEELDIKLKNSLKIEFVPVVRLPLSGYVMKAVWLMIMFGTVSKDVGKMDIMSWNYEDEEKILGEAVRVILPEGYVLV